MKRNTERERERSWKMGLVEQCLVLWLVWFGAALAGEEEGRSSKEEEERGINQAMYEMRRPGFLYTRNTGRCTPQYVLCFSLVIKFMVFFRIIYLCCDMIVRFWGIVV